MEKEKKAYQFSVLAAALKQQGLDVAEDAVLALVDTVFDWVGTSAKISPNKFDDALAGFLPAVKGYLHEEADKIDGKVG